ncbi:MAG: hypothetical protein ACT4OL_11590 [Nitrospiraceae bacterium]
MRPGELLSLGVTLPNERGIKVSQAGVRWSRGQKFAVENATIERHTYGRLQHYVKRLVQEMYSIIEGGYDASLSETII